MRHKSLPFTEHSFISFSPHPSLAQSSQPGYLSLGDNWPLGEVFPSTPICVSFSLSLKSASLCIGLEVCSSFLNPRWSQALRIGTFPWASAALTGWPVPQAAVEVSVRGQELPHARREGDWVGLCVRPWDYLDYLDYLDLPCSSDNKDSACSAGDPGSIPGSERLSGEGNSNPLQYSCLENPMDRGDWQATVQGVAKSRTRLSD